MNVSCVYCYLICFVFKISVYLCVLVSFQTSENYPFFISLIRYFAQSVSLRLFLCLSGIIIIRPPFLCVVGRLLMLIIDCFNTEMDKERAYVSILFV